MKIYISTDMEGLQGINAWHHVNAMDKRYKGKYLVETLEWVINGIKESKYNDEVEQILICDSHSLGENIPYDFTEIDDRLYLLSGGLRDYYMMAGFDDSFDIVFFVGYHGGVGTRYANMDHTYSSSSVIKISINGIRMNETTINAAFAGWFNVPVGLVIGDQALFDETKPILNTTEFVITKQGLSRFAAIMRPKNVIKKEVINSTIKALDNLKNNSIKVYKLAFPYTMDITFKSTEMADQVGMIPGVERVDGLNVRYKTDSYPELMQTLLATVYSATIGTRLGE
jgi:D-amino peptidase